MTMFEDPLTRLARLAKVGDWATSGPTIDAVAVTPPPLRLHPRWTDGVWVDAAKRLAHPGRVGGPIQPFAVVVHTTDMMPDEWDALVDAWTRRPGDGACAHFLISRNADHGVIQLIPITRNGNHAGGPGHGVFRVPGRGDLHPNLVSVGIELHCAGGVQRLGNVWRLVEGGKAHGAPLPDAEVTPARPGRGWHQVTEYQLSALATLLTDLDGVLAPVPAGCTKVAFGETPPAYAVIPGARIATHCELDPQHRADPWPQVSAWLRSRV